MTIPNFHRKNAHLWFDGSGNFAGFVISENGGHEIAIITGEVYRCPLWGIRTKKKTRGLLTLVLLVAGLGFEPRTSGL